MEQWPQEVTLDDTPAERRLWRKIRVVSERPLADCGLFTNTLAAYSRPGGIGARLTNPAKSATSNGPPESARQVSSSESDASDAPVSRRSPRCSPVGRVSFARDPPPWGGCPYEGSSRRPRQSDQRLDSLISDAFDPDFGEILFARPDCRVIPWIQIWYINVSRRLSS
jgi:hypothetical protein